MTLRELEARLEAENGPRWEQLHSAVGDVAPREMTAEDREALRERMRPGAAR